MATAAGALTDAGLAGRHIDGRTLRRTRNRTAVIDALLDIAREGSFQPSAHEIADRAGVSHRSIFRYFEDLDDLVRTAIKHSLSEAGSLTGVPDIGTGSLEERIAILVDARLTLHLAIDGTMQLARMRAPSIPSINDGMTEIADLFRAQIAEHFSTELALLDDADRALAVDAVLVLTSYDSFALHRKFLHSDSDRIRAAWLWGLRALFR
jgi:AcrR family transcriptional regulator